MFFVSVIALFCAYTHSFSVLGKICEGWNCSKIGDIAPLKAFVGKLVSRDGSSMIWWGGGGGASSGAELCRSCLTTAKSCLTTIFEFELLFTFHSSVKLELHEQQNCCNLQQNLISTLMLFYIIFVILFCYIFFMLIENVDT